MRIRRLAAIASALLLGSVLAPDAVCAGEADPPSASLSEILASTSAGYAVGPEVATTGPDVTLRVDQVLWGPEAPAFQVRVADIPGLQARDLEWVFGGRSLVLLLDARGQPGWLAVQARHSAQPDGPLHVLAIGRHATPVPWAVPRSVLLRAGQEGVREFPVSGRLHLRGDAWVEIHMDLLEVDGDTGTVPAHLHGVEAWHGLTEQPRITLAQGSPLSGTGQPTVTLDFETSPGRPLVMEGVLDAGKRDGEVYPVHLSVVSPLLDTAEAFERYVGDRTLGAPEVVLDLVEADGTAWTLEVDGSRPQQASLTGAGGQVLEGHVSGTSSRYSIVNGVSSRELEFSLVFGEALAVRIQLTGAAVDQATTSPDAVFGRAFSSQGATASLLRGLEVGDVECSIGTQAPQDGLFEQPATVDPMRACELTVKRFEFTRMP